MNDAFSFLISLGIIAFGIWIVGGAIAALEKGRKIWP